jgi:Ran GTPase-activating protein (RanGAP) involved in mRNA processing and transport
MGSRVSLIAQVQRNDVELTEVHLTSFFAAVLSPWSTAQLGELFAALHTNTHVTSLDLLMQHALEAPDLRQAFVRMLARNRSITKLKLCRYTVDGSLLARGLKQHPMLEELTLTGVKFDAPSMRTLLISLLDCPGMQSLILREIDEPVLPLAMTELCTLLHRSLSLRHLGLSCCGLRGASLRQLAEDLSTNPHLRKLDLDGNKLEDDDAICIADVLSRNCTLTEVDLSYNGDILYGWSTLSSALQRNRTLLKLGTVGCGPLDNAFEDRRIIEECVSENTDAAVHRERAALIERLQRNDAATTEVDARPHRNLHNNVDVVWTNAEARSLFDALHRNAHVAKLALDAGQSTLRSSELMQQFSDMLAANHSIRQLRVYRYTIDGSLLALGLQQHSMLEELTLDDVKLDAADMQAVFRALLKCPALHILDLHQSCVTSAMIDLRALLRGSRSLRTLNMSRCIFHGAPLRELVYALSTDENLRSLNLSDNGFDVPAARCIADMLTKNRTLTQLNLSRNSSIGEAGGRALADALRNNHTLTELSWYDCNLGDEAKRTIDEYLARNKQAARVSAAAASEQQSPSSPSVDSASAIVAASDASAVPSHSVAASAGASNALSGATGHRSSGPDDGWATEPCVPTAAELRAMGASDELSTVLVPLAASAASGLSVSDSEAASEPCVPTDDELQAMRTLSAAAPPSPAAPPSFDQASRSEREGTAVEDEEEWRRMPGVPNEQEQMGGPVASAGAFAAAASAAVASPDGSPTDEEWRRLPGVSLPDPPLPSRHPYSRAIHSAARQSQPL